MLAVTLFFYFSIKAENVEVLVEGEQNILSMESSEARRAQLNKTMQKQKRYMHRTTRSATRIYQASELVILTAGTIGIFFCLYYLRSFSKQKMHRGERIDRCAQSTRSFDYIRSLFLLLSTASLFIATFFYVLYFTYF